MKRAMLLFLILVVLLTTWHTNVFGISAESYCVTDADSGRILYEKNAIMRRGMASTTKIMTALVALESGKIDEIATVSSLASRTEGSSLYLKPGEQMRVYDLVCGLMLNSGNDAAIVLAEHISGSVDAFVALMNETAAKIGAADTHFVNPNGLSDENHYTTAHDLAKITAYAMKNPQFCEIVATKQMTIATIDEGRKIYLTNHNKLLVNLDGCDGVKTGFTKATGRCLVSSVMRDGIRTICVTLNAPDDWNDHTLLHNQARNDYQKITLVHNGDDAGFASVQGGILPQVRGVLARSVDAVAPVSNAPRVEVEIALCDDLQAPVLRGQTIGSASVFADGIKIGDVDVVAERSVAKLHVPTFPETFMHILRQTFGF